MVLSRARLRSFNLEKQSYLHKDYSPNTESPHAQLMLFFICWKLILPITVTTTVENTLKMWLVNSYTTHSACAFVCGCRKMEVDLILVHLLLEFIVLTFQMATNVVSYFHPQMMRNSLIIHLTAYQTYHAAWKMKGG